MTTSCGPFERPAWKSPRNDGFYAYSLIFQEKARCRTTTGALPLQPERPARGPRLRDG